MSAVYALIGNPNCGKTTLFNALTGARQQIGNWPGVTVEKKEGTFRADGETVTVTDLPGLYSLSPYSAEERVTRDLLLQEPPDLILNIADATHLERSLYLTLQLAELGYPMVLALNMTDRLAPAGLQLDVQRLEHRLGIPVVPIAAGRRRGIAALTERARRQRLYCAAARSPLEEQEQAAEAASLFPGQRELQQALLLRRQRYPAACRCSPKEDTWYSSPLLSTLLELEELLEPHCRERHVPLRFAAVRMLDGDEPLQAQLGLSGGERERIDRIAAQVSSASLPRDMRIADEKYRWIEQLCRECLTQRHPPEHRSLSDRIDAVVTHRLWAFPLLFAVLGGIFYLTFGPPGRELSARFEQAAEAGRELLRTGLQQCGAAAWLVRLICDGILSGLGAVLSFFPQLLLLFFFLSVLEDSGYMARAAFLTDRLLHRFGLSGHAFVPLLLGFGCSVPGILATRALPNEHDRRLTLLLIPFMSCSARLPVYVTVTAAFFPKLGGAVILFLYLLGMAVAVGLAAVLNRTVLRGGHTPFVLELPSYRMPTLRTLALHLGERLRDFAVRAGTVLLLASMAVWFLQSFSPSLRLLPAEQNGESLLAALGRLLAPLLRPLGFGSWQVAVALLSGLIAKEAVIGTLTIAAGSGSAALGTLFPTRAAALSFLVFVLLYAPCTAAFSALRRELHSLRRAAGAALLQTGIAWGVAFAVYQFSLLYENLAARL